MHLFKQLVEDVRIHDTQQDEKGGADGAADDTADGAETVEPRGYCSSSGCHDNRGDNDNADIDYQYEEVSSTANIDTYVEWPNEKKVPTVTGICPVASSLLVIKSIAYRSDR